jgi:GGDEF domain-containing protein
LSFGLAAYDNTMQDSTALLEAADRALLAAEAAGGGVEFA